MSNKEYEICKVMDFLQVPEDRIDECLLEFKDYLKYMRAVKLLTGGVDCILDSKYIWVDDGEIDLKGIHIRFEKKPDAQGKEE